MKQFKPSKKHIAIIKTILAKGYYKPTYSDQEPATKTLIKLGIVDWRSDFKCLILTEYGNSIAKQILETNPLFLHRK